MNFSGLQQSGYEFPTKSIQSWVSHICRCLMEIKSRKLMVNRTTHFQTTKLPLSDVETAVSLLCQIPFPLASIWLGDTMQRWGVFEHCWFLANYLPFLCRLLSFPVGAALLTHCSYTWNHLREQKLPILGWLSSEVLFPLQQRWKMQLIFVCD